MSALFLNDMAEKKSKYLIWLETLHREYTDRTNITLFGQQAASIRLLADMFEVRCRFKKVLERMQKEAVMLDDEGVDYQEWISREKWKRNESILQDEDIRSTLGFSPESPLPQNYADSLLMLFEEKEKKTIAFNADNFRNVVSSVFILNQIVDPQRMEVAIDNELKELQLVLLGICNAKDMTLPEEFYANYYDNELLQYKSFMTIALLEQKHKKWKNNLNEEISLDVLKERRVELILNIFDSGFLDDLKKDTHRKPKEDVLGFREYEFENWKGEKTEEALQYFEAFRKICPYNGKTIDFSQSVKIGKYIHAKRIGPALLADFFENMELIKKVQYEMLKIEDPSAIVLDGEKPAKCFVEMVKKVMLKAEDENGETKTTKVKGHEGEYKYNVEGKAFCKVMDELLITHETDIENYLGNASAKDAIGIKYVVPFIGALIDTHLFTTEKMLKKDFNFVFEALYEKNKSAITKMSDSELLEEAEPLIEIIKRLMKKPKA